MMLGVMLEPPAHAYPGLSSGRMPQILGWAVNTTVLAGAVGALIIEGGEAPTGVLVVIMNLGVPVGTGDGLGGGDLVKVVNIVE